MNEVDYTGWVRTPANLKQLKNSNWKRFKFHCRRVYYTIRHRRWYLFPYAFKQLITNSKAI